MSVGSRAPERSADAVVLGYWPDRDPLEALDIARMAEASGFGEVWVGEMATFDAFALATAIGLDSANLALTIGPLAVHVRSPAGMAMGVASVATLTGRPVRLALGTSSPAVVAWHGRRRDDPVGTLAMAASELTHLLAGERGGTGFRLRLAAPGPSLTLAAFGPNAVRLAARMADRMVLNMVTTTAAARYREMLDDAAGAEGRPTPRLAAWLPAAVDPTPATKGKIARGLVQYLQAPGYAEVFIEAGFAELVSMARTGTPPRQLLAAVPDELPRRLGLVGTAVEVSARIGEYRSAGVEEICIVPATADDDAGRRTLEALAPGP